MCNEFAQERAWKAYCEMMQREALDVVTPESPDLPFTATRRPTDPALVISAAPGGVAIDLLRWGLPKVRTKGWTLWIPVEGRKDPPSARALVPIDWFYEYRDGPAPKPKFEFTPAINEPVAMGVFRKEDRWAHYTTKPGPEVFGIHDRQPALVRLTDWRRFLTDPAWPADLMVPSPAGMLKARQVR